MASSAEADMRPGEVQLWRIVNTSWRSGLAFVKVTPPLRRAIRLRRAGALQMEADGATISTSEPNYHKENCPILMASGNRVDLLVKAPDSTDGSCNVQLIVRSVDQQGTGGKPEPAAEEILLIVEASGLAATGNSSVFISGPAGTIRRFPIFSPISSLRMSKRPKCIVFESLRQPRQSRPTHCSPSRCTRSTEKVRRQHEHIVLLNTIEEWKIENRTFPGTPNAGKIDHPFHIHINPFQVVEVFEPNDWRRRNRAAIP